MSIEKIEISITIHRIFAFEVKDTVINIYGLKLKKPQHSALGVYNTIKMTQNQS